MKKRLFTALLLCLLLTGCSGFSGQQDSTEPTAMTINVYQKLPLPDLFIGIPEGYEETSSEFYDTFYQKDDATIIITQDDSVPGQSVKDYSVNALSQYMSITSSLTMRGDSTTYAGSQYVQLLEFDYQVAKESSPMTTMVGYTTDGTSMFIVTCKCHTENYEAHRAEFLTAIESIRIDKEWHGISTT